MSLIRSKILKLGYKILGASNPYTKNKLSYSSILPGSIYSPWFDDINFQEIYRCIRRKYTLVDEYRCFELWQLVEQVNKIDSDAHILEVGVWKGGTSAILAKQSALLLSKAKIYSADTFTGVVKASDRDASYFGGEHSDTSLDLFLDLLKEQKLDNVVPLEGIFPDETSIQIPNDTTFKLCHIDVDVYLSAKDVQDWIWSRLIIGGVVIFDDYGFGSTDGITNFVNEQRNLTDRIIIYNLNGHGIIIKIK
jgi:O-methyltransferase